MILHEPHLLLALALASQLLILVAIGSLQVRKHVILILVLASRIASLLPLCLRQSPRVEVVWVGVGVVAIDFNGIALGLVAFGLADHVEIEDRVFVDIFLVSYQDRRVARVESRFFGLGCG